MMKRNNCWTKFSLPMKWTKKATISTTTKSMLDKKKKHVWLDDFSKERLPFIRQKWSWLALISSFCRRRR